MKKIMRLMYKINAIFSVFNYSDNKFKIRSILIGFESNRKHMYPNFKENKKYYFKDYHRYLMFLINEKNQYIFTQLTSYFIFSRLCSYTDVYGVFSRREFISYKNEIYTIDDLLNLDSFVVKHVLGGKGKYIHVIHKIDKENYVVNNNHYTKDSLLEFLLKLENYIVQEFVEQDDYINNVFSQSTNTIRVITMREKNSNNIYVSWAAQRIGTTKTAPVDNWSVGGLSSLVDIDQGTLGSAKYYDRKTKKLISYNQHPDSGQDISNIIIPRWDQVKSDLLCAHKSLPSIYFIAWDIVVTKAGYKVLEVNNTTGVEHIQVHYPLLSKKNIYDFYKYHKIVK